MKLSIRHVSLAAAIVAITGITAPAHASSHREAPNITKMPKIDATDFYMFNSYEAGRGDYVTIIANYIPLQDAYGGPNYFAMDENALYEIHIDNDGDAVENMTFQFQFNNSLSADGTGITLPIGEGDNQKTVAIPLKIVGGVSAESQTNLGFNETYTMKVVSGPRRTGTSANVASAADASTTFTKPLDYVGNKTFTDAAGYKAYTDQYIYNVDIPNCAMEGKLFVGQRQDPFAVNLGETFDLVNYVPVDGDEVRGSGDGNGFPGGITQSAANNDLADKNVTTIAIEVAKSCLTGSGNGVIGGWTTASVKQARLMDPTPDSEQVSVHGGAWVQASRLGSPLVNEVVIGLSDKDAFNEAKPSEDGQFADYVTHPTLPAILNVLFRDAVNTTLGTDIYDLAPANIPRNDLVAAFLTGVEGVNQMSTVTASEMLRLNTGIAAVSADSQSAFGVAGDDLAGFPNGRRPGDDVTDIALRVVMGALCHPVPVSGTPTELGLCPNGTADAPVGNVAFTDGAPVAATDFTTSFPYLNTPIAGSPN